jgi:hypothetical protein
VSSDANPAKFYLRFTGLCEFVPRYDIEDAGHYKKNRVKILLVDTNELPDVPHEHDSPHAYDLHFPVFVCPLENVYCNGIYRRPDATYYYNQDGNEKEMAVFYLDDQDVWIANPQRTEDSLEIVYRERTGTGCIRKGTSQDQEYTADYESFSWVAPLAEISPGSESVDPNCLCREGVDSSALARVELREGRLTTYLLAMDGDNKVVNWRFKLPDLPDGKLGVEHRQALADIVELEANLGTEIVMNTRLIRISKNMRVRSIFASEDKVLPIRVVSVKNESVTAWIKNMPWAEIFEIRLLRSGPRMPEVHFAHFYKMSLNYDDANVPHPAGQCGFRPTDHQGNPNCPPARAAASDWDTIESYKSSGRAPNKTEGQDDRYTQRPK